MYTCMKFYDAWQPLYVEADASDIGLGAWKHNTTTRSIY